MADLITTSQLKTWLNISDSTDDTLLAVVTAGVSSYVRKYVGRSFNVDGAQVASARYYWSESMTTVPIDDCYEITAVATDNGDDNTYSTTWSSADWYALPAGGIGPDGTTGWPYTSIKAVESRYFPAAARPAVKVTGKWGWLAMPDDVTQAALMLGAEFYNARSGGFDTFTTDTGFTQIRRNIVVRDLLQPYRRSTSGEARFGIG